MNAPLLTLDDALAIILAQAQPLAAERVSLGDAAGRYLAHDLVSGLDLPPFHNSAMDGYALRAEDTPGTLTVVGESAAGVPFDGILGPGQAITISTGAVMPDGADSVAIIERVTRDGDAVAVPDAIQFEANVRHAGSDVHRGDVVLPAGMELHAAQIGAAASLGLRELHCGRRPTVAVVATGTELTEPGQPLVPGSIYNSNGPMLMALIEASGGIPTLLPSPADDRDAIRHALAQALEYDVVITSGGVSVGPHDLVREIGYELGISELFWRVKLRPGKPLSFGVHGQRLVFGIPGNPVSTLVCFELFVRPALQALQGASHPAPPFQTALLSAPVRQNSERDELIRVQLNAAGELVPLLDQQSHQLAVTAQAHGFARIPTGSGELAAGTRVAYLPQRGR